MRWWNDFILDYNKYALRLKWTYNDRNGAINPELDYIENMEMSEMKWIKSKWILCTIHETKTCIVTKYK